MDEDKEYEGTWSELEDGKYHFEREVDRSIRRIKGKWFIFGFVVCFLLRLLAFIIFDCKVC